MISKMLDTVGFYWDSIRLDNVRLSRLKMWGNVGFEAQETI